MSFTLLYFVLLLSGLVKDYYGLQHFIKFVQSLVCVSRTTAIKIRFTEIIIRSTNSNSN